MPFAQALSFLKAQVDAGVVPSAAVAVGCRETLLALEAYGSACVHPQSIPATLETRYDMASLTKPMATAVVAMKLVERGALSLADTIGDYLPAPEDKRGITLLELLTHTGGLPAHILIGERAGSPGDAMDCLLGLPLIGPPGGEVVYSCLGYIILGKILELAGGAPLDRLARELVFVPLGMERTGFGPVDGAAATEYDQPSGTWLRGVVHDENARFLGGVAGNAGLFSTVGDCARFAAMLATGGRGLLPGPVFGRMVMNHTAGKAESRGLGFSLMDEGALSCGEFFAPGSFGHTGFTGTSLWVDAQTGLYVVLLTNAVHFGRDRERFFRARRIFHNLVAIAFGEEVGQ